MKSKKAAMLLIFLLCSCNLAMAFKEVNADFSDWPWLGRLVGPAGKCAATLISKNLILTAAHCILSEDYTYTITDGYTFEFQYDGKKSKISTSAKLMAESGFRNLEKPLSNLGDWAILKIDQTIDMPQYPKIECKRPMTPFC